MYQSGINIIIIIFGFVLILVLFGYFTTSKQSAQTQSLLCDKTIVDCENISR